MSTKEEKKYNFNGSAQNYFWSPKMPSKDHSTALKTNYSGFKTNSSLLDHKAKKILGQAELNQKISSSVMKMKQMKLMQPKDLQIVGYTPTKDNSNIGSHHDRQTNPGYSRNKLGGFFTS